MDSPMRFRLCGLVNISMSRSHGQESKAKTSAKNYPKVRRWSGVELRFAQLRTKTHELSSYALITAAVCLLLAALELGLQILIPGSPIRTLHLPIGARFFLICYSLMVLFFFVAISTGCFFFFRWSLNRIVSSGRTVLWIAGGFAVFLTWFILLVYGASWGLFWQTGSFIDSQAFLFVAPHPLQVFHWVDTDLAVMLVALALGGTWVILIFIPRWITRWPVLFQRRLVLAWSWLIGLCVLGSFLGELYSSTDERQFMRTAILYNKIRDNTSGPLPHVLADIQKHIRYRPEERVKADDIRIIQRPVISMEKYLATARPTHRWNVIILVVESLRADQLRAYGSSRDIMPTVDDLSRESRVFLNAYTHSSHTDYATVTPFSSHYPLRSNTSYIYPEKPSYPRVLIYDVLKAFEYHTAIFSSSNEFWGGMINFLQTGNIDRFFHAANFKGPSYVLQGDAGFAKWTRETKHAGSVDDRYTVSEAIQWIESLKREPFFLGLNFQSSHLPYMVPRDFPRRFGPAKLDFTIRFAHFPREKIQIVKDIYADSLAYVDAQIARLFEYLKSKGMWDSTIIVLTGDHGQAFYEHGFASHASAIFNEVMKVPLVIRAPQLKPGTEDGVAQHVDIAPAIVGLLGLPVHPSFQGIDLLTRPLDPKRSAYMVAQTPLAYQYGIVRSGYKLIYDERDRQYSLYDLVSDPGEKTNIASSRPELLNELAKRLQTWRTLQIEYYADKSLQAREYPPILAD
jgi:arylsulfatase A-like enzyme